MQKWINIFKKIQRPLIICSFILCILVFVYALVFSTDLYKLFVFTGESMYVEGSEVYFSAQVFNQLMLNLSIPFIIIGISMFVFFAQKRRIYYLSNYITCGLYSAAALAFGVLIIINVAILRADFLHVDFEAFKLWSDLFKTPYTESTLLLDLGFVLGALLIISAALVLVNMLMRYTAIKREREEKENEPVVNITATGAETGNESKNIETAPVEET